MNKVFLMGRLTKAPEIRYTSGNEPIAVARYTLAVNRRFKKNEADFINCVAFGAMAEFAEKYMKKGQLFAVVGRIQVRSWDNRDGKKQWTTEVVVEEQYFTGSKSEAGGQSDGAAERQTGPTTDGFFPIEGLEDDDLPF